MPHGTGWDGMGRDTIVPSLLTSGFVSRCLLTCTVLEQYIVCIPVKKVNSGVLFLVNENYGYLKAACTGIFLPFLCRLTGIFVPCLRRLLFSLVSIYIL